MAGAIARSSKSDVPPGGKEMMKRSGRVGVQSWANATPLCKPKPAPRRLNISVSIAAGERILNMYATHFHTRVSTGFIA